MPGARCARCRRPGQTGAPAIRGLQNLAGTAWLVAPSCLKAGFMPSKQPKVFISYAREDVGPARRLFDSLTEAGAEPWLDVENLLPGQHWELEIEKAIKQTDFVIALLSSKSMRKRGFMQQELRSALSTLDEIPEGDVFLKEARPLAIMQIGTYGPL
jgi:hypothetical protein